MSSLVIKDETSYLTELIKLKPDEKPNSMKLLRKTDFWFYFPNFDQQIHYITNNIFQLEGNCNQINRQLVQSA